MYSLVDSLMMMVAMMLMMTMMLLLLFTAPETTFTSQRIMIKRLGWDFGRNKRERESAKGCLHLLCVFIFFKNIFYFIFHFSRIYSFHKITFLFNFIFWKFSNFTTFSFWYLGCTFNRLYFAFLIIFWVLAHQLTGRYWWNSIQKLYEMSNLNRDAMMGFCF